MNVYFIDVLTLWLALHEIELTLPNISIGAFYKVHFATGEIQIILIRFILFILFISNRWYMYIRHDIITRAMGFKNDLELIRDDWLKEYRDLNLTQVRMKLLFSAVDR